MGRGGGGGERRLIHASVLFVKGKKSSSISCSYISKQHNIFIIHNAKSRTQKIQRIIIKWNCCVVGKSMAELLGTWKREAEAALSARVLNGMHIDLFKVIAERKVRQIFWPSGTPLGIRIQIKGWVPLEKPILQKIIIFFTYFRCLEIYQLEIWVKPCSS